VREGYTELIEALIEDDMTEEIAREVISGIVQFLGHKAIARIGSAHQVSVMFTKNEFGERRWWHRKRGRLFGPFATKHLAWVDAVWVHKLPLD